MSDSESDAVLEPLSDEEREPKKKPRGRRKFTREETIQKLKDYEMLPKSKWHTLEPGQKVRVFLKKKGDPKFRYADYSEEMRSGEIKNLVKDGIFIFAKRNGRMVYSQKLMFKDLKRVFLFLSPGDWDSKRRIDSMEHQITMLKHRLDLLEKRISSSK